MEVIAYEMEYSATLVEKCNITCIPFASQYFPEYMKIYNECFYEMRKALDIEPYNYLSEYKQIAEKAANIYLILKQEEIIGSVACNGNEIDDLIVNRKFQHQGYGTQLLLWGMHHIRQTNDKAITLHVAEWNKNALLLYQNVGFKVIKVERIR